MTLTMENNNNVVANWETFQGGTNICDTKAVVDSPYNVTIIMKQEENTPSSTFH